MSLFTEEEQAAYLQELSKARDSVVYPVNPCLYTPSIKIHQTNKKIEKMKDKYKQNKALLKDSKKVVAMVDRLA